MDTAQNMHRIHYSPLSQANSHQMCPRKTPNQPLNPIFYKSKVKSPPKIPPKHSLAVLQSMFSKRLMMQHDEVV